MKHKMIYLARRNPKLAAHEFAQAWREHSALGAQCTNVRDKVVAVRQCARVLERPMLPGFSADYDGVNLLTVKSLQAAHDIWNDAETLAVMKPDEPRVFSTYVRQFTLVCEEAVVRDAPDCRDAPRGRSVVVAFLHGPALAGLLQQPEQIDLLGARALVLNRVCEPPPPGYDYGLIAEWWYADAQEAQASLAEGPPWTHWPASAQNAVDTARCTWMWTEVTHSRP